VVLHLGEAPASKVLGQWLQAGGAVHVQVHAQQRIIDPLGIVTERVYGQPSTVCNELAPLVKGASGTPWLARWQHAERRGQAAIEEALSAETVAHGAGPWPVCSAGLGRPIWWCRRRCRCATSSGSVGRRKRTVVHSNRGANGIDGVIATGIGVAAGTGEATVVHVGDVAFCHDQSSLTALAVAGLPLTIVVTDNDGGGIFSFLPQATTLSPERFEQLFGTPHGTDVVALAAAHGLGAICVVHRRSATCRRPLPTLPVAVVRVVTDRAANVQVHDRLHAAVAAALDGARATQLRRSGAVVPHLIADAGQQAPGGQGRTMAESMACSLACVSASSLSGSLSATMPPPATRRAVRRSAESSAQRMATAHVPSPAASTQPTAPP
jgi:2-succinyl-5-enolpyruvyl-6-hydroxy-3-cyclohexene-1-carboxylate synthase